MSQIIIVIGEGDTVKRIGRNYYMNGRQGVVLSVNAANQTAHVHWTTDRDGSDIDCKTWVRAESLKVQSSKAQLEFKTFDHPEANGRAPVFGESAYSHIFITETGMKVTISTGEAGFQGMTQNLMDMLANAPSTGKPAEMDLSAEQQAKIADLTKALEATLLYMEATQYWQIDPHDQKERHAFKITDTLRTGNKLIGKE